MYYKFIKDIIKHREIIKKLSFSEIVNSTIKNKLGLIWLVLDSILYMGIYYFVVQVIFQKGGPNYSVFVFLGLIPWKWTASTLQSSVTSISSKGGIIQQIPFPKIILVISNFLVSFYKFLISLPILFIFLVVTGTDITIYALYLPLIILIHGFFLFSLFVNLANIGVFIPDVKQFITYALRALFYLSAILYPVSSIPDNLKAYLIFNPFISILQAYKDILLYYTTPDFSALLIIFIISLVLSSIGIYFIYKNDKKYAKVI